MKPIREQLREQAETIRQEWAKGPSPDGSPRRATIELTVESPLLPLKALRDYLGRVNSDATYAPEGCLLLGNWRTQRTAELFNGGMTIAHRVTVDLEYRDYPWNYLILVATTTSLPASKPKILVDSSGRPAYQPANFNEWLDALESPCGGTSSAPDEPPPEPGSWHDRPAQL